MMDLSKQTYTLCSLGEIEHRGTTFFVTLNGQERVRLTDTECSVLALINKFETEAEVFCAILEFGVFPDTPLKKVVDEFETALNSLIEKKVLIACPESKDTYFNYVRLFSLLHAKYAFGERASDIIEQAFVDNPELTIMDILKFLVLDVCEPTAEKDRMNTVYELSHNHKAHEVIETITDMIVLGKLEIYK